MPEGLPVEIIRYVLVWSLVIALLIPDYQYLMAYFALSDK
jgi:hypothetical protein